MQLPNDLTDNERKLIECLLVWMGTAYATAYIYQHTNVMFGYSMDLTDKLIADLIGDQQFTPKELMVFALDYISDHAD